jgi:formylglycine-generating enzyme required for sulfatase activity
MPDRPSIPAEITRQILVESGHRCAVCGANCPLERAHIIPWHKSKEHKAEDLICLCASCHERADLEKWGEKTLREYKQRPWVVRQYKSDETVHMPNAANERRASIIPNTDSLTTPFSIPHPIPIKLHTFQFDTVVVDLKGNVTGKHKGQARYFIEDLGCGVSLEMVQIPEGELLMGAPEHELRHRSNEKPQHRVRVPSFFMSKFEITEAQWYMVRRMLSVNCELSDIEAVHWFGNGPGIWVAAYLSSLFYLKRKNLPIRKVPWKEALEFCSRLSVKTGRIYRLPTEAEWEYACRANTSTPFSFGETIIPDIVNYRGTDPYGEAPKGKYRNKPIPVGSLKVANPFGLYDMHGNLWEWCQDSWHNDYNGAPSNGSAWENPEETQYRVQRGGSYRDYGFLCRCAARWRGSEEANEYNVGANVGFRVVASITP